MDFKELSIANGGDSQQVSDWKRPEKIVKKVLGFTIIGGLLYGLYTILPALVAMATNTLSLVLLCTAIAAVLYVVTNKKFLRALGAGFDIFARKLTSFFIEIDPVAIVEKRLVVMREKINVISRTMGNLKGLLRDNKKEITKNKAELDDTIKRAKIFREQGKIPQAQLEDNQIVRLTQYAQSLQEYQDQSEKWYEVLSKLEEMAKVTVLDTERDIIIKKKQFELVKKQHKAYSTVMGVLNGDQEEFSQFNQAMEFMAKDINAKLGEMEHVIEAAGGLMDKYDANKALNSEKAKEILERYDKFGIEGLFGSTKQETTQAQLEQGKTDNILKQLQEIKEAEMVTISSVK